MAAAAPAKDLWRPFQLQAHTVLTLVAITHKSAQMIRYKQMVGWLFIASTYAIKNI